MENLPQNTQPQPTKQQDKYIVLAQSKKIAVFERKEAFDYIRNKIKLAYFESGFDAKLDTETLNVMTNTLYRDIITDYKTLTTGELSEAMHQGVRKKYGEYMGISVVSILSWIDAYLKNPERKEQIANYQKQLMQPKQISQTEIESIYKEIIPSMIAEYKRTGNVMNYGNARYEYLVKKELIAEDAFKKHITDSENIVRKKLLNDQREAELSLNRKEVRRLDESIANLTQQSNMIMKEACRLAVLEYIKTL